MNIYVVLLTIIALYFNLNIEPEYLNIISILLDYLKLFLNVKRIMLILIERLKDK